MKALCTHAVNVISHTKVKSIYVLTRKLSMMVSDIAAQFASESIPRQKSSENILKEYMKVKDIFVKNVKNP